MNITQKWLLENNFVKVRFPEYRSDPIFIYTEGVPFNEDKKYEYDFALKCESGKYKFCFPSFLFYLTRDSLQNINTPEKISNLYNALTGKNIKFNTIYHAVK